MSEYWKSTPSYWCKFCSQYVRDSPLERKNHDASGRHQNNISRSLRELHKNQERETRDKQRAKDEVARLNGLFSDKPGTSQNGARPAGSAYRSAPAPPAANLDAAAQRRAHAEQLAAMGVALPDELKKEVTGIGNFHVVSERALELGPSQGSVVTGDRSLAEILAEAKREPVEPKEEDNEVLEEESGAARKRKIQHDDDDARHEEAAPRRRAWGSDFKTYPGEKDAADDDVNLDALLNGIVKKKEPAVKAEGDDAVKQEKPEEDVVKQEDDPVSMNSLSAVPDVTESGQSSIKVGTLSSAAPAVVFKKRKGKK